MDDSRIILHLRRNGIHREFVGQQRQLEPPLGGQRRSGVPLALLRHVPDDESNE